MSRRLLCLGPIMLLLAIVICGVPGQASAAALYDAKATWGDTNLPSGGEGQFSVQIRNIGDEDGKGALTIVDQLPPGVTATHAAIPFFDSIGQAKTGEEFCSGLETETVKCTLPEFWASEYAGHGLAEAPGTKKFNGVGVGNFGGPQPSGYLPTLVIDVAVDPDASGTVTNEASVYGGGATLPGGSPCAQAEADLLALPPCAEDVDQVSLSANSSSFGLVPGTFEADLFDAAYPFGSPARQAGSHPFEARFNFDFNAKSGVGSDGSRYIGSREPVRTIEVTLPRGVLGNPEAIPKCDPADFARSGSKEDSTGCPANTQVGYLSVPMTAGSKNYGQSSFYIANAVLAHTAIYNLTPPKGAVADFGFNAGSLVQAHIYGTLDSAQNYAIKAVVPNISSLVSTLGSEGVFWGVPADPAHGKFRYYPKVQENEDVAGAPFAGPIRPFFTNPMDCGFDNGGARIRLDSYGRPGEFTPVTEYGQALNVTGCNDQRFRFKPDIALQPTDRHAGAPTGLDVHLQVPQRVDEVEDPKDLYYVANGKVEAIATPPIKKAVVTLPEGMTISPSAAQGLSSCTPEEIGLGTDRPVTCPDSSQYGKLVLHTPILPVNAQPEGFVYLAKQNDNPFHNFLSLYLVIQEPERGILVKIPARVDLDPATGQIKTSFDDLPQFPVSDMQMTLKGGVRAGLVNPSTCGQKTITAEFFSWQDPTVPHVVESSYGITEKPDGSPCVSSLGLRPFKPSLETGTTNNTAGYFSPFVFRLTRTDDDQEFSQLGVKMAEGLIGKLAGVGRCSGDGIARAVSRSGAGEGMLEEHDPSCPASSLIGTTQVGAGVGVPLTYVPGWVYLAGPYRNSPLSIVVITPVVVGPYDLGVVAVRTALNVDHETARVSAVSDPFPQIFQGIPVRIRDIRLNLDRPDFILNPTSCAEKQIDAHITGTGGDVASTADDTAADLANRFQAADCASLGFKPKLSFRLFGGTRRGTHPRLKAVVKGRPGDANIAGVSVALPHSEFLDQAHIKTVCTRVQFAAKLCPAGSVYGHMTAKSPLFDESFSGPVYLRSSSHPLPDVVAALRGPASLPIEVDLDGRVDSVNGGIRNTFEFIPDAPVTTATFTLLGGKKGLLVNSTDLCASTHRATARFKAQNGKRITLHPELRASCGKQGRNNKAHPKHHQSSH